MMECALSAGGALQGSYELSSNASCFSTPFNLSPAHLHTHHHHDSSSHTPPPPHPPRPQPPPTHTDTHTTTMIPIPHSTTPPTRDVLESHRGVKAPEAEVERHVAQPRAAVLVGRRPEGAALGRTEGGMGWGFGRWGRVGGCGGSAAAAAVILWD